MLTNLDQTWFQKCYEYNFGFVQSMSLNTSFLQLHFDSKGASDGLRNGAFKSVNLQRRVDGLGARMRGSLSGFSKSQPTTRRCKPKRLRFRNGFFVQKISKKMQYSNLPLSCRGDSNPSHWRNNDLYCTAFLKHPHSINLVPSRYWSCGLERWLRSAGFVLINGLDVHQAKTGFFGGGLIHGAKLLPDICSKVIWGTCMCIEVCGIYTQLKNRIVGWIFDVHLRQKQVLFAGLSIKDLRFLTQRDILHRHGNLCKLGMFTILQDWKNHTKKVKFYLHQLLFRKHPFPKTPFRCKNGRYRFSNLTNRCKVTDWAAEVSQKTWGDHRGKANWQKSFLEKFLWELWWVWSLVSGAQVMIGTVQLQWPQHLCSIAHFPHWWSARRTWLQIVLPSKPSHREPKSVGCEVPISTSKSSADLIRSHLQ